MNANEWSAQALTEEGLGRAEALAILESSDDRLLAVLDAAFQVRRRYFGRTVNLHVLQNAKSGHCQEDCAFCSQSSASGAPIERYTMQTVAQLVEGAQEAARLGAVKYCMVISGRSPSGAELEAVCEAVRQIKQRFKLQLCTSLGLLTPEQARQLKAAGVDRYNHNLETARRFFPAICHTHAYEDRVRTIQAAKAAGMEACCGGILGLGETLEDRVDLAFALRALRVEAIPVNFFNPRPGTRLADQPRLKAMDGLRALAMFRLVNPSADIRAAGGREVCLGPLQVLALYAANSLFTKGYLTTPGQGYEADMNLLAAAGFEAAVLPDV